MSESGRQRGENESRIDMTKMVRDHQQGTLHSLQVLAAQNARPSQQHDRWPHQQIVSQQTNPSHWPSQHPSGIVIGLCGRGISAQYSFEITDRPDGGESSLAEVDLITVFKCAQQLDAVE